MATTDTQSIRKSGNVSFRDASLSPSRTMWDTCPLLAIAHDPKIAFVYENDFFTFTSGEGGLAATLTDSGTAAVQSASSAYPTGTIKLTPSDGTVADNDEAYLGSESVVWILGTGKDVWCEWIVKYTEANVDDANIMCGLCSVYAANTLVDNGAGPPADYDGINFFKVDGGTVWQAECAQSTNHTTLTSLATRKSGSWQRLGFHVTGTDQVDFYIDGVAVGSISTHLPTAAMGLFLGAKNGDTNNEGLYADYVKVVQLR